MVGSQTQLLSHELYLMTI